MLTDRSSLSKGTEFGVVSAKPWRLADLVGEVRFPQGGHGLGEAKNAVPIFLFYYGRAVSLTMRLAIMQLGEFSPLDRPSSRSLPGEIP